MKKVVLILSGSILFSSGLILGQEKKPELKLEDKVDVLQAQLIVCRTQMSNNQVSNTVQDLVKKVEAKYPGFTLNLDNGTLQTKKSQTDK